MKTCFGLALMLMLVADMRVQADIVYADTVSGHGILPGGQSSIASGMVIGM